MKKLVLVSITVAVAAWPGQAAQAAESSAQVGLFESGAGETPPPLFGLLAPPDGAISGVPNPLFDWEDAADPGDQMTYTFLLATDSLFDSVIEERAVTQSLYNPGFLPLGQDYWWKVRLTGATGPVVESVTSRFTIPGPGDLDGDVLRDITDVVDLIGILLKGETMPDGVLALDVNGDCRVNLVDVVYLIIYLYRNGPAPGGFCYELFTGALLVPQQYGTIQEAVDAAGNGDTVLVLPGIYTENVVILAKNIVLLGDPFSPGVTLHPTGATKTPISFIDVGSRSAELTGFLIKNTRDAQGVLCANSSPTIRRNHIRGHSGGGATGIMLTGGGNALVLHNIIRQNHTGRGAAIGMFGGAADVIGNQIDSNRASIGGAIYFEHEPANIVANNTFRDNYASGGGGALFFISGEPVTVTGNLFLRNTSNHGGAIDNADRDSLTITNNTFDSCVAGISGGGGGAVWWARGATIGGVLKNNVVTNSEAHHGGAFGCDPEIIGQVELDYNVVWNNDPDDYHNFTPGPNSQAADPSYCDPAVEDYRLSPGSPCLGSGKGGADIGAFGPGCDP